jgi:hypothetical protein
MDMQGVSFHSQQYESAGCIHFHSQQYGRARCVPFHNQQNGAQGVSLLNAGMSDCPASSQSGTGINDNADAGTSPVRNRGTQSGTGMIRYQTEIQDAGNADAGGIDLDTDAQLR